MRRGAGGCVSSPRREMTLWARCGAPKRRRHVWLRVCRLGARVTPRTTVWNGMLRSERSESRRDRMESGSYRAETSVVRNVHHAVLHSREDRFSPRFRRDLRATAS